MPSLVDRVKSGALPPADKRIPQQSRIIERFAGKTEPTSMECPIGWT
jgi:hypothetical protein